MSKENKYGLNVDKRKSLMSNALENGIERKRTKNSGLVKIKQSQINKLVKELEVTTSEAQMEYLLNEIQHKEKEIEKYLNK